MMNRRGVTTSGWLMVCAFLFATVLTIRGDAQATSPLAWPPKWSEVAAMQEAVTREEFSELLEKVYAPNGTAAGLIEVGADSAKIVMALGTPNRMEVRFAPDATKRKAPPRFWRTRAELGMAPAEKPLRGMRIALDPGHLGGEWARMEARWFRIGETQPVMEGDLALAASEHLSSRLEALGAEVLWVRREPGPVTTKRPSDFFEQAREVLAAQGITHPRMTYASFADPERGRTVQNEAELLFYRQQEIRDRALRVNEMLHPDLVLCLHYNADAWGAEVAPSLAARNHFHTLVNGCYSATELRLDDNRYEMLLRLLGGITTEEQRVATKVAEVMARRMALPPFIYHRSARRVNGSPYVWARNLLANRLYRCPVVYLEPYVMNTQEVWGRVQAGDYEGERLVAGSVRKSLVREYADAVAEGVAAAMRGE